MAGPEQVLAWVAGADTARRGARSPYRHDDAGPNASEKDPDLSRFAWVGRTSTYDQQDPTLSLPRQLRASEAALPENALIVAHFYDVESGRLDLNIRGRGSAHEQFDLDIPRDGGIQDLLAEAETPGRRFDYVICEAIDRIARRTYYGTGIEHRLEQAGVRLLAADEPFQLTTGTGRRAKVATQLLTRRVKQGIAEFYVVEMLEKAWDGFAIHTEEGYNVGKPPYGYQARRVPHPVPAKRAKGQRKTFLEPDPVQAPVVKRIFKWRWEERLGYADIADRLNSDLTLNPPPTPVDPNRAVGHWTWSNVREILINPKHTGHMVWNRRARKGDGKNQLNPVSEWIWSPHPVHEALVDLETFIQVQSVPDHRFGSRSRAGANTKHPHTKRSYLFRTFLFCELCKRRMFGKTRHGIPYYVCGPKKGYVPAGHPGSGSYFVREDVLVTQLNDFLNGHVFGRYRRTLLEQHGNQPAHNAHQQREQEVAALKRAITDIDNKIKKNVRSIELVDDLDQDFIRDINERRAELRAEKQRLEQSLADAQARILAAPNTDLIDALPIGPIEVERLPEDLARRLFEALRLEIHYNVDTNETLYKITITSHTLPTAHAAARDAIILPFQPRHPTHQQKTDDPRQETTVDQSGPILIVPPAGIEPAT
ncbi:recombinase family protein [Nocardia wallacei]|uniref:recombinase family protein n=1 Tax=Nocardia wallacei TaxID=480035 RepID=UPI00245776BC|nr:recombinase family protein [Nocardia wallacei]